MSAPRRALVEVNQKLSYWDICIKPAPYTRCDSSVAGSIRFRQGHCNAWL